MTDKERLEEISKELILNKKQIDAPRLLTVTPKFFEDIEWLINRVEELESENRKLKAFYDYFAELYGKGLEVDNWHGNGDLEPFDNFFEGAEEEMEGTKND